MHIAIIIQTISKIASVRKNLFYFLFLIWIITASFSVFYNIYKMRSEIKEWGYLSDSQKRQKIFGDSYNFCHFIQEHTNTQSKIFIFSKDGMTLLYCRYYLYPRLIYWKHDQKDYISSAELR